MLKALEVLRVLRVLTVLGARIAPLAPLARSTEHLAPFYSGPAFHGPQIATVAARSKGSGPTGICSALL
jgi:hypothetical protein